MTELSAVQASSYTDASSELSLTELGRVAIAGVGWMISSDNSVHTEDGMRIGTVTAISQVMEKLGWITYSEPRPDYIQSGITAVNWSLLPKDFYGDIKSYELVGKLQYIIEVSYDYGITCAIELFDARVTLNAVKEAAQNGIDGSLLVSLAANERGDSA